jgi:hypothetical protein
MGIRTPARPTDRVTGDVVASIRRIRCSFGPLAVRQIRERCAYWLERIAENLGAK